MATANSVDSHTAHTRAVQSSISARPESTMKYHFQSYRANNMSCSSPTDPLLNTIESVKEKLTSDEYQKLLTQLAVIHGAVQPLHRYLVLFPCAQALHQTVHDATNQGRSEVTAEVDAVELHQQQRLDMSTCKGIPLGGGAATRQRHCYRVDFDELFEQLSPANIAIIRRVTKPVYFFADIAPEIDAIDVDCRTGYCYVIELHD